MERSPGEDDEELFACVLLPVAHVNDPPAVDTSATGAREENRLGQSPVGDSSSKRLTGTESPVSAVSPKSDR